MLRSWALWGGSLNTLRLPCEALIPGAVLPAAGGLLTFNDCLNVMAAS